jgi:hypothetical protein
LKWDVAFPIEGFTLDITKPISVNDVIFELNNPKLFPDPEQRLERHHIKDIRLIGVVRTVEGKNSHEIKTSAYKSVDKAVNIIQFLVTRSLRTVDEVYFIRRLDGPEIDNQFKILTPVEKTVRFGEFDAQKYMEDHLKPFAAVKPDKKETLERALAYYRIAVCAYNPYQAIDSFFGAIQAIVEAKKGKKLGKGKAENGIKEHMKPIIIKKVRDMTEQKFWDKFACYYGRYRSDGTHGRYHVTDYSRLIDANKAKYEVAKWTHLIINEYIEEPTRS